MAQTPETAVIVDTSSRLEVASPADPDWWRAADGLDHAFRATGAWMHSLCAARVRWTVALTPAIFGPTNPCPECLTAAEPTESELRAMDGNR